MYDPHIYEMFNFYYNFIENEVVDEKYNKVIIKHNYSSLRLKDFEFFKKGIFDIIKNQFTLNDRPLDQVYFPEPYFQHMKTKRPYPLNTYIDGIELQPI